MLLQAGEVTERLDSLRAVKVGLILVATDLIALALMVCWLGGRDSNPDSQIQSLESYHWTTSQQAELKFTYRGSGCQLSLNSTKSLP